MKDRQLVKRIGFHWHFGNNRRYFLGYLFSLRLHRVQVERRTTISALARAPEPSLLIADDLAGPDPSLVGSDPAAAPDAGWLPTRPPALPAGDADLLHRAPRPSLIAAESARPTQVTVRRGDTLWHIAARHLGPHASATEIAAAWPRWYAANRAVIGDDPDAIYPGQLLNEPQEGPS